MTDLKLGEPEPDLSAQDMTFETKIFFGPKAIAIGTADKESKSKMDAVKKFLMLFDIQPCYFKRSQKDKDIIELETLTFKPGFKCLGNSTS